MTKIFYSNSLKLWFAGGTYCRFLGNASHIGINQYEHDILYKTFSAQETLVQYTYNYEVRNLQFKIIRKCFC